VFRVRGAPGGECGHPVQLAVATKGEDEEQEPRRGSARKAFLLRMDPALWAELERWAADELRSVNGQIELILRRAVKERKGKKAGD
jgi:hypothetical protein